MLESSWVTAQLAASQEGFSTMKLVRWLQTFLQIYCFHLLVRWRRTVFCKRFIATVFSKNCTLLAFYFGLGELSSLKTEIILNSIHKLSSYLTGNITFCATKHNRLMLFIDNRCLLWKTYWKHRYTVWAQCNIFKHTEHMEAVGFQVTEEWGKLWNKKLRNLHSSCNIGD
jgi:hypothetical protein